MSSNDNIMKTKNFSSRYAILLCFQVYLSQVFSDIQISHLMKYLYHITIHNTSLMSTLKVCVILRSIVFDFVQNQSFSLCSCICVLLIEKVNTVQAHSYALISRSLNNQSDGRAEFHQIHNLQAPGSNPGGNDFHLQCRVKSNTF